MRRAWLLVLLSACSPEQPVTQTPAEPVVVYAAYADKAYLPGLFERYSDATGVTVIVRHGDRESIVDDLIADNILPPADVIVTPSLRGMTRAADEGALRPLPRSLVGAQVPDWLRDADGYWVALGYRVPLIVYDTRARNLELPATFEDLADERFRGRLCLSTSVNFVNRTIIATLIGKLGERPTELVVRGWIANLATGVFASEQELVAAVESGRCTIAVVASDAYLRAVSDTMDGASAALAPGGIAVDVEAAGIGRHARNTDGAAALIAWMLEVDFQREHALATLQSPASDSVEDGLVKIVAFDPGMGGEAGEVAWQDADVLLLLERARYP